MLPIWLEIVLLWLVLGSLINMFKLYKGYYKWIFNQDKYEEGYQDGIKHQTEMSHDHWHDSSKEPDLRSITNHYFKE